MTDRHGRGSLADDPTFIASLDDLDRGLGDDEDYEEPVAMAPRRPPPPRAPRSRAPAVPPRQVAETDPPGRRPLLDLFPPSPVIGVRPPGAAGDERPPGPLVGTAVGPRLAHPRTPREVPRSSAQVDPLTYETFYGIAEKPFGAATDPKFFYQSGAHERAMQELEAAIRERQGVAVLTGELGVGKTTVCRAIARELDRRTVTSLLLEPFLSVDALLKTVLVDFGVISRDDLARAPDVTSDVLIATLRSFLESLAPLQANAVIIVDEVQNLPIHVLPQLLAVVEAGRESGLLQVVLAGEPALGAILKHPELRPLAERVAVQFELGPLAADEIIGYVTHRLTVAGSSGRVDFSDGAFTRLYELSRGVPRVVNLLCDRALSRGHQASASVIDAALIDAAAEDLDLGLPAAETRGVLLRFVTVVAVVALMLVGAAAALWVFRDSVGRTIEQWEGRPTPPGGPVRRLPVPLAPIPPDDPPV